MSCASPLRLLSLRMKCEHKVALGEQRAVEINDLFEQESPAGQLYMKLREESEVERERIVNLGLAGRRPNAM